MVFIVNFLGVKIRILLVQPSEMRRFFGLGGHFFAESQVSRKMDLGNMEISLKTK